MIDRLKRAAPPVLERAVKTFAQAFLAVIGVGTVADVTSAQTGFQEVPWTLGLSVAVTAAIISVVTSLASWDIGARGPSAGGLETPNRKGKR